MAKVEGNAETTGRVLRYVETITAHMQRVIFATNEELDCVIE